jgi:hypothetical protein
MTKKKTISKGKDLRSQIVAKAIVDPAFRRKLLKNPKTIFGQTLSPADKEGLERIKKMLPALDSIVTSLAGEVLCGGGGCGGLA